MALTRQQRTAAQHLADDRLSDVQIAKLAGVSRAALSKWKKIPIFM
jgi:predicted transcriptional regulator